MKEPNDHDKAQAALIEHQGSINATRSNIATLKKVLDEQENTLTGLLAEQPDMEELAQQNEDMLAEVAVGELDIARHHTLCGQMTEADAALLKLNPQIDVARQTISGLRRKIAEQESTLSGLQNELPWLVRKFLLAEGNIVAVQYLEKAEALISEYRRLEGIAMLLRDLGHVPYPSPKGALFAIPAYRLPAFDGKTNPPIDPEMVYNACHRMHGETMALADREANRIRALGVEFDRFGTPGQ